MSGSKIISDPVFGFIRIPSGLLLNIVKHPFMQRLTRIKQLGLTTVVYPGAQHTRFQHSLGAFHLMSEATLSLQHKGVFIFDSEAEAVQAAILMHDIGHGPFSHVLENTLIKGITHEEISLMVMNCINQEMNGELSLAIKIFKNDYPKRFLHQLISSQLDMDRLDYLKRDSFFTGVTEGNIGSARIIKMLNVVDDTLVIDDKGIYSIENFLTSRRLMYWQVYLHKATVGYEKLLISLLLRAKKLLKDGYKLFASPALAFFLNNDINAAYFKDNEEMLTYLSDKAPNFEKQHRSRNFIVEETETNNIIGFFSLSLKVVDISDLDLGRLIKEKLNESKEISFEDFQAIFNSEKNERVAKKT